MFGKYTELQIELTRFEWPKALLNWWTAVTFVHLS